jgi:hypothetical protein
MICYGVTNSVSAIGTGSVVKLTGRVPVVCCAFLLHLGILIGLLNWAPTPDDKILFFVVTGLWGICDGVWLVQINGKWTLLEHEHCETSGSHGGESDRPDDEGSTHLWNVGLVQRDYTVLYPRSLTSWRNLFFRHAQVQFSTIIERKTNTPIQHLSILLLLFVVYLITLFSN